ncbi:hypothetical protein J7F01_40930 [Streptomyces sp. ISL-22]|uniref:hypothetical protein n=1 Tax=unclassified Streptomyces TaxID=2593676 RepID=UPI001BED205E|nr:MULTISPECIES: hypothetical protein [unclassified Streptomyces]MBT2423698.1 hypothetical protein [Streptomyces sp. ISL-24]MBT2438362.1 hypothetical protein [Streptomyces sp. ISL-22]
MTLNTASLDYHSELNSFWHALRAGHVTDDLRSRLDGLSAATLRAHEPDSRYPARSQRLGAGRDSRAADRQASAGRSMVANSAISAAHVAAVARHPSPRAMTTAARITAAATPVRWRVADRPLTFVTFLHPELAGVWGKQ